jgi:hypothetical protein
MSPVAFEAAFLSNGPAIELPAPNATTTTNKLFIKHRIGPPTTF